MSTKTPKQGYELSFDDALEAFKKFQVFRNNMILEMKAAGKSDDEIKSCMDKLEKRCNSPRWVLSAHGGVEYVTLGLNTI